MGALTPISAKSTNRDCNPLLGLEKPVAALAAYGLLSQKGG